MPQDSVPWAIGGGAQLQPEMLRAIAWHASGAGQGVGSPVDCKVLPTLAAPDNRVHVQPGVVVMRNAFPGVNPGQSYMAQWLTEESVTITATGGSGRSDLLIAKITDPQYDGSVPADVEDGPYRHLALLSNVAASTKNVDGLNLGYPAEALARIDIPANTAAFTAAMIVDLRRLARGRSERLLVDLPLGAVPDFPDTATGVNYWPANLINIDIPAWATKMVATYTLAGIAVENDMWGQSTFVLQDFPTPVYYQADWRTWDFNGSAYSWDWQNENIIMSGTIDVRPIAGKSIRLFVASQSFGAGIPPGFLHVRPGARAIFDAQFQEAI